MSQVHADKHAPYDKSKLVTDHRKQGILVQISFVKYCNHLAGEERAGCFALFVFLESRDGWVALPCGAMGLSVVCDCGIS